MTSLSIIIPARNEIFLQRTIQDILEHAEADTEVIAILDGRWAEPPIPQHPKVTVLYYPESIGQRAACNRGAAIARGKYLMKADAHCSFAQGFDRILLEDMQPDWTQVPVMRNLHAFDWVCPNGHRRYQGPSGPCAECGEPTTMEMVWIAKNSPQSTSYCFDSTPHFQYFRDFAKRPEGRGDLTETMSLQGSCFMLSREKYFELGMNDESWGSWGSQGIEISVKTWLSGGKCIVNHKTWQAHLFRTQGDGFGFPYPISGKQVDYAKKMARDIFFNNKWDKQIRPLSWLIKRFMPVPGWTEEDLSRISMFDFPFIDTGNDFFPISKIISPPLSRVANNTSYAVSTIISQRKPQPTIGIVYYTDSQLDRNIANTCFQQLLKAANGLKVVSVSLKPLAHENNIMLNAERGYLTMFEQILAGLEAINTDIVFFAEHDVLYHPSHFEFVPPRQDIFYYNTNVWKLRSSDGHCLHYDVRQTSGLCAYRGLLLTHYRERVRRTCQKLTELGDSQEYRRFIRAQGFEPGTHGRAERVDDHRAESWRSLYPNIDVRHSSNLTPSRWRREQFRNQKYTTGWTEADEIPGWGKGIDLVTW